MGIEAYEILNFYHNTSIFHIRNNPLLKSMVNRKNINQVGQAVCSQDRCWQLVRCWTWGLRKRERTVGGPTKSALYL